MKGHETTNGRGEEAGKSKKGKSGAVNPRAGQDCIAQADTLFFYAVKEPPRPHKFRSQNAQAEENGEPSGARRDDHDDPQGHDGKAEEDLQKSLRLVQSFEEHRFNPTQPEDSVAQNRLQSFDAAVRLSASASTQNSINEYVMKGACPRGSQC